jgi:hypothetical protein
VLSAALARGRERSRRSLLEDTFAKRYTAGLAVRLWSSSHPDEHHPERPILLAVDQQFGEDSTLRDAGPMLTL